MPMLTELIFFITYLPNRKENSKPFLLTLSLSPAVTAPQHDFIVLLLVMRLTATAHYAALFTDHLESQV